MERIIILSWFCSSNAKQYEFNLNNETPTMVNSFKYPTRSNYPRLFNIPARESRLQFNIFNIRSHNKKPEQKPTTISSRVHAYYNDTFQFLCRLNFRRNKKTFLLVENQHEITPDARHSHLRTIQHKFITAVQ